MESMKIWRKLGIPENKILQYGPEKNWWSRAGIPDNMPAGEPGGPDSEVFYEFTQILHDKNSEMNVIPIATADDLWKLVIPFLCSTKKQKDGFKNYPRKMLILGRT